MISSVRDGEVEIALKLVVYEVVSVGVSDGYGNTALHYSSYFNRLRLIDFILKCNGIDINQCNTSDAAPLHLASERKHVEAARRLLDADGYSVEIEATNSNGWTALHFACFVDVEKVKSAESGDQKEDEQDRRQRINDMIDVDLVRLLVDNGCNVNAQNSSQKKAFDLLPVDCLSEDKLQTLRGLLN